MSRVNRKKVDVNKKKRKKAQRIKSGRLRGRKNKRNSLGRVISITLFVILIGTASVGVWMKVNLDSIRNDDFEKVDASVDKKKDEQTDTKKPAKIKKVYNFEVSKHYEYDREADNERYHNILVMGIDGEKVDQSIKSWTRTDVMMLVSIDSRTKKINIISIPRDTYCEAVNSETNKINSAHAIGGPKRAALAVSDILDTQIDDYVKVNYQGFRDFIDAIDGVDVVIDKNMIYDDEGQDLKIRFYKGDSLTLDGKKAEEYIRWRKNNAGVDDEGDGSDSGRINKMQYFLKQVLKKTINPGTALKLNNIMAVLKNNIQHTVDDGELFNIISNASSLSKNVSMRTMEGYEQRMYADELGYNQDYYVVDGRSIMNTLKLFHGEKYLNKRHLRIKIENCSGVSGLAGDFGKFLRAKGYGNIDLRDGQYRENSQVDINNISGDMKKVFEDEVNMENIEQIKDSNEFYDVIIRLGADHEKIYE